MLYDMDFAQDINVAPYTGAWIETPRPLLTPRTMLTSRPAGARGLKHGIAPRWYLFYFLSPLSQGRGLKPV